MAAFDKSKVRRWRRDVYRAFQSQGYKPAEIMAASVLAGIVAIGTDPDLLSELTGLSPDYVRKVTKRLRQQRVVSGRTIRAAWMHEGDEGLIGEVLDAGVAAGVFVRGVNQKRSAAQKARKPETRARGPRGPRAKIEEGTIAPPIVKKSNPLYGLPEWEQTE